MNAVMVVQARMGSTRLPGKVLEPVAGRPMLLLMLDRLSQLDLPLVLATSDRVADDPIADLGRRRGLSVHRGSEHDVLARFIGATRDLGLDHVVRLTADCPLIDPSIVGEALALARSTRADYLSNSLIRTFPDGLDVEVVTFDALQDADREASRPDEREHVTPFIYRRPERYRLEAIVTAERLGAERWTVDTEDDLARIRGIVADLVDPATASWREVLRVAGRSAEQDRLHLVPRLSDDNLGPESTPETRTWIVHDRDGAVLGWIGVHVRTGRGDLRGEVPEPRRREAVAALQNALHADLQVTELHIPHDWSHSV